MMITRDNLLVHEFIGLGVEVTRSSDRGAVGLKGKIIDETKNTLEIESRGEMKRIPKKSCIFRFELPGNDHVDVDGKLIAYRPEDRPKKLFRLIR